MSRSNLIKRTLFPLVVSLVVLFASSQSSYSGDFELLTHVLDEFAGRAESDSFLARIGSGGQGSVIGISEGTNFDALQGYVHSAAFVHGDVNADGGIGLSDVVYLQNYLLMGGPAPIPLETGDVNCDNEVGLADLVYLSNYVLKSGDPPCNL